MKELSVSEAIKGAEEFFNVQVHPEEFCETLSDIVRDFSRVVALSDQMKEDKEAMMKDIFFLDIFRKHLQGKR